MKKTLSFVCLILWFGGFNLQAEAQVLCSTPPPAAEMDALFYQALKDQIKSQKIRIAIFPFQDGSQLPPDPILEKGFGIALIDLLSSVEKVGVYSPLVIMNTVNTQGLTSADFFSSDKIAAAALALGATHAVSGMFQRQGSSLRFFIKILDVSNGKMVGPSGASPSGASPILEFMSEQSERFFTVNTDVAKEVLGAIGKEKIDPKFLGQYVRQAPSFEAFRYYLKGMERSTSYQEVDLGIAKVWFEKATTLSYDFYKAYEEKARVLYMTALIRKQMGEDSSLLLQDAERALRLANFTIGIPNKKKPGEIGARQSTLRWWIENFILGNGTGLMNSNKVQEAVTEIKNAVQLVPEDGIAHSYLAKALSGAAEETVLAKKLNPCL